MSKFYAVRHASETADKDGFHTWVWLTEETEEFRHAAGVYILGLKEDFKLLQLVEFDAIAVDANHRAMTHDEIMGRYNEA